MKLAPDIKEKVLLNKLLKALNCNRNRFTLDAPTIWNEWSTDGFTASSVASFNRGGGAKLYL